MAHNLKQVVLAKTSYSLSYSLGFQYLCKLFAVLYRKFNYIFGIAVVSCVVIVDADFVKYDRY